MSDARRLTAPEENLGVLVEPDTRRIHAALGAVRDQAFDAARILDVPLSVRRAQLRRRLGLVGPVVVTGHQAEFFHAGVFAKTIAAHELAAQTGGSAVFLSVDSDVPKSDQLTVPQVTAGGVRRVAVNLPGCDPRLVTEQQPRAPRAHWLEFFTRTASLLKHYDESLLPVFADAWLATEEPLLDFCDALSRGRRAVAESLGLTVVRELRLSQLCRTPEFDAFAAHLILAAADFAVLYNEAQAAYRVHHRERNPNRPVPPLAVTAERVELPLWVLRPQQPRARLFVVPHGADIDLFADAERIARTSRTGLENEATRAQPWSGAEAGWQLRPRALTLSAFARLFLADLFIHGIGGATYDEITAEVSARFFGVPAAPMCCVSATVRLPLPRQGVTWSDIQAARRESRDIRYNPQRYLRSVPAELVEKRAAFIRRSDGLRATQPAEHEARRLTFQEIRRVNRGLLRYDPWRAAELDERVQALEQQWQLDRIALDREYFFALHTRTTLQELVRRVRQSLGGA